MEWTGTQLRQLCADNGVEFSMAEAFFGGKMHSLGGESFSVVFQDGTYTHTFAGRSEERPFQMNAYDYNWDGKKGISIRLATYLSAKSPLVGEDTYENWSAAFRAALDSREYKQFRKYRGLGGVLEAFKSLLVQKLGALGEVKRPKRGSDSFYDRFVIKGVGAVQFWDTHSADTLYVGSTKNSGRGWGEVKFSPFVDDLEAKATEVVQLLKTEATKHGFLVAEEKAEPGPVEFENGTIEFEGYSLDTGDKRTCGSLSVYWKTSFGKLEYGCVFDSAGDVNDDWWSLDGENLVDHQETWKEVAEFLELQPPHYYFGPKAEANWREKFEVDLLAALQWVNPIPPASTKS